jgi:hypothetical protein
MNLRGAITYDAYESDIQRAVFQFFAWALPPDAIAFAIPNGDGRATRMPGALAGMPDVGVLYRGRLFLIELKRRKGVTQQHQTDLHVRLTTAGAVVAVCRSVEAVQAFLAQVMPLRGRVAA